MNKSNSYGFLQWETWLTRAAAGIPKSLPADHAGGHLIPGHSHFWFEKTQGWRGKDMNPVGEGHVLVWFSQNQKMHLPNDKALTIHQYIPITFPNYCSSLEAGCNFKWKRTHHAIVNPKWCMELYFLQDTFPTMENTGHQSSSMELSILNLQVFILNQAFYS